MYHAKSPLTYVYNTTCEVPVSSYCSLYCVRGRTVFCVISQWYEVQFSKMADVESIAREVCLTFFVGTAEDDQLHSKMATKIHRW